jgi:hypothetical protein
MNPPTQIHNPRLDHIDFRADGRHGTTVELLVTSHAVGVQYRITLTDPRLLVNGAPAATKAELSHCFSDDCSLLSVFEDRAALEFSSHDGFQHGVKGRAITFAMVSNVQPTNR